jgi:hypothetical protein
MPTSRAVSRRVVADRPVERREAVEPDPALQPSQCVVRLLETLARENGKFLIHENELGTCLGCDRGFYRPSVRGHELCIGRQRHLLYRFMRLVPQHEGGGRPQGAPLCGCQPESSMPVGVAPRISSPG